MKCVKISDVKKLEMGELEVPKSRDGSVVFKDENSEIKFRIPRPVMTDAGLAFDPTADAE